MTLMLLRSAQNKDLKGIHHLAEHCGVGMTSLPNDAEVLDKRLRWSTESFKKAVQEPENEFYLFVLEDTSTGKIVGTSAVEALTGQEVPLYSYKLSKRTRICTALNLRADYEVLYLVNDNQNRSELCTLYLDPVYRKQQCSALLSRARFLFMGNFPNRFSSMVIAEMRGICNAKAQSPFWDDLGYHFFQMSFADADRLTLTTNKQFIADLMPRNPIYVKLLSTKAQEVIGKPHESTIPAMSILLREGFHYNNYVDIFDAGPTVEAFRNHIRTITASRVLTVKNALDTVEGLSYLISNIQTDFRATCCPAILSQESNGCIISKKTAQALQVAIGDEVRVVPLQIEEPSLFSRSSYEP